MTEQRDIKLSVVLPVFNEQDSLKDIYGQITQALSENEPYEILFIDDGSTDGSFDILAEIQQTSDTTYRIYDWDRIDAAGMKRELHTEEAIDAIEFKKTTDYRIQYKEEENRTTMLVKSPYFITRFINADKPVLKNISELDSFVIYMAVEGQFTMKYEEGEIGMKLGEAVVVPASMGNFVIHPNKSSKILEIFIDAAMI